MNNEMSAEELEFFIKFYESVHHHDGSNLKVIELLGGLYTEVGRVDDGLKMDQKLIKLDSKNPTAHYNLACSFALKDQKDEACKELILAIKHGYDDFEWMMKDSDLESLHSFPKFLKIIDGHIA